MSKDINLLSNIGKNFIRNKKLLLFFRITAISLLIIVSVSSITLFIFKWQSPLGDLKKEENRILSNMSQVSPKTVKYLFINDRLNNISNIISQRTDFEKKINILLSEVPQGVSVDSVSIDKKTLSVSFSSSSLYSMGLLIDNLTLMINNNRLLSKVIISGVGEDVLNGNYSLSAKAELL